MESETVRSSRDVTTLELYIERNLRLCYERNIGVIVELASTAPDTLLRFLQRQHGRMFRVEGRGLRTLYELERRQIGLTPYNRRIQLTILDPTAIPTLERQLRSAIAGIAAA